MWKRGTDFLSQLAMVLLMSFALVQNAFADIFKSGVAKRNQRAGGRCVPGCSRDSGERERALRDYVLDAAAPTCRRVVGRGSISRLLLPAAVPKSEDGHLKYAQFRRVVCCQVL